MMSGHYKNKNKMMTVSSLNPALGITLCRITERTASTDSKRNWGYQ